MRGLALAALLLAGCGGSGPSEPAAKAPRPPSGPNADTARKFADWVSAKEYDLAYTLTSKFYQDQVGYEEYKQSITRYRDGVTGSVTYELEEGETDLAELRKDGVVELLVPEDLRAGLTGEVIVRFKAQEGEWACVLLLTDEGGSPKILNYYQDD